MAAIITNLLTGGALSGVASVINSIRGKSPEDAAKLQQLQLQYAAEFQNAEIELVKAQLAVNQAEAGNVNMFVAGWRPFVGWVCGVGLGVQFLINPLFTWIAALAGQPVVFPSLDLGTLLTLLFGLLGLGAMRTVEKVQGVVGTGH